MGELQQTSDPQLADSMSLWPVEIAASEPSAVKVRDLTLEWLEYYTQIPAGPRPIGYPVSFQKDFKDSTTRPSAYLVPVDPRPNPSWSTSSWNRIQQIGSQSRPEAELKPDFHIEPLLRPTTTCRGVRLSRGITEHTTLSQYIETTISINLWEDGDAERWVVSNMVRVITDCGPAFKTFTNIANVRQSLTGSDFLLSHSLLQNCKRFDKLPAAPAKLPKSTRLASKLLKLLPTVSARPE